MLKYQFLLCFVKTAWGVSIGRGPMLSQKDEHKGLPSAGSSSEGQDSEKESENRGTLTFDATCAPAHIRFPQDISL